MTVLTETSLIFGRAMRRSLRNPTWVILGLIQPVLYLVLFGPLLEPIVAAPGFPPGDAWQVFVPGLLIMLGIFGGAFVGFELVAEYRAGVIERMRVAPVSRIALLLGRVLRDVVVLVVQAVILVGAAMLAFGLRAPIGGVALALALVALLGVALAAASYAIALRLKSEDALAPLTQAFTIPVLLLSGILLPMTLAPGWLYTVSRINPFSHVVDAARAAFRGDFGSSELLIGTLVTFALVALSVWWGTRTFQRENA